MSDNFFNLNNPDFYGTILRFVINTIFLIILIRGIYFKYTKKEKFAFTFFLMGIMVFFLTSMLNTNVLMQFSFGFGLFAIFAILRFRTRNFSLKDMSYIFTVIGVSLINSLKLVGFPVLGVIIFNIIIILSVIILEKFSTKYNTTTHTIVYENIELLTNGKKQKLLKDVSDLTGKEILRVKIRRIDFKEKIALLDIYYKD
ncbi:MAG: DUF4956 domain-containing protein [Bacteroidales bacterium]|nr:DUF4956 domain-containing protein [Bacteroidales bacterium]